MEIHVTKTDMNKWAKFRNSKAFFNGLKVIDFTTLVVTVMSNVANVSKSDGKQAHAYATGQFIGYLAGAIMGSIAGYALAREGDRTEKIWENVHD